MPSADDGWMRRAACLGRNVEEFFPVRGSHGDSAKAVCRACPVREPCLNYGLALDRDESAPSGIFGGLTASERSMLSGTPTA